MLPETFCGDPSQDDLLRKWFRFPSAPNINLAKGLLDLCERSHKAGQACLEVCAALSDYLSKERGHSLNIIGLIQQVSSQLTTVTFLRKSAVYEGG